jgi:hypothetical protein
VFGNPLSFSDPFGLIVRVVASDPVTERRLEEAYAALNRRSAHARKINEKLEKSCTVYEIRPQPKSDFYCPASGGGPDCVGKRPNTAYIDPYFAPKLTTVDGPEVPPLPLVIGHELGHADGFTDGGMDPGFNVLINENPEREDMGLLPRSAYGSDDPNWYPIQH